MPMPLAASSPFFAEVHSSPSTKRTSPRTIQACSTLEAPSSLLSAATLASLLYAAYPIEPMNDGLPVSVPAHALSAHAHASIQTLMTRPRAGHVTAGTAGS